MLIEGATRTVLLHQNHSIHEGGLLRELIELGFELTRTGAVNPAGAAQTSAEWSEAVLEGNVRSVAGGLGQYVQGFEGNYGSPGYAYTNAYRDGLDYLQRLMRAAAAVDEPSLQPQMRDAKFLSHLVNLGGAYAALNPDKNTNDPANDIFLNQLWNEKDNLQQASQQLNFYLNNSPDYPGKLVFDQKLLASLRFLKTEDDWSFQQNIAQILDWGSMYWKDQKRPDENLIVHDPSGLFQAIFSSDSYKEVCSKSIVIANKMVGTQPSGLQILRESLINFLYIDQLAGLKIPGLYTPDATQVQYARQHMSVILDEAFDKGMDGLIVYDIAQIAYVLATASIESLWGRDPYNSGLETRLVEKSGSKPGSEADHRYFKVYDGILGNRLNTLDYYTYRGRGYVQLTGRKNYEKLGSRLRLGKSYFIDTPVFVEQPEFAAAILWAGMMEGLFAGSYGLSHYIDDGTKQYNWNAARAIVNGAEGYYDSNGNPTGRTKINALAPQYYSTILNQFKKFKNPKKK
jgi:hypothetical protein